LTQPPAGVSAHQTRRPLPATRKRPLKAETSEKGRVHLALFVLLVVDSLFIGGSFFYTHVALSLAGTAVSMLLAICVIIALVKQHENNLKHSLRKITWAALGYVCFSFVAGYIVTMTVTFQHPEIWQNQWEMFKMLSSISPWESPLLMTVNIIALCAALIISIPGFLLLKNSRPAIRKSSELPASPIHSPVSKRNS